jgi:hypothetical protein
MLLRNNVWIRDPARRANPARIWLGGGPDGMDIRPNRHR